VNEIFMPHRFIKKPRVIGSDGFEALQKGYDNIKDLDKSKWFCKCSVGVYLKFEHSDAWLIQILIHALHGKNPDLGQCVSRGSGLNKSAFVPYTCNHVCIT
jgi:hypothetical protein